MYVLWDLTENHYCVYMNISHPLSDYLTTEYFPLLIKLGQILLLLRQRQCERLLRRFLCGVSLPLRIVGDPPPGVRVL